MNRTEKRDLRGYAFIRNRILHSGVMPSLREIGRDVGYASPRSVQLMLERLRKRGLLSYSGGVVKLSSRQPSEVIQRTVEVPLVGSVACGFPTLAEQNHEALVEVSTKIARPGHAHFMLRAMGTSMNKSGIDDGDLVLVRQQTTAEEGERVVALINDEATIKHFHRDGELVVLRPNSTDKRHNPIVLSDEFMIQGVVVATFPANLY
jgi:repressor LexA